jgi:thiol-disulfide isomerase/thioredoxin
MEIKELSSVMAFTVIVLLPVKSIFSAETSAHATNSKPLCVATDSAKKPVSTTGNAVCNQSQNESKPVENKSVVSPDKEILFFMNPNGQPCKTQLSILDGMKDKINGLAKIKYVKTTETSDQNTFYQYGIRGLPSLIILGKDGKELKRFTPGVQTEQTILSAFDKLGK